MSRDAACTALGLDPKHRYVLLNLGGGGVSDPESIATAFHQILSERSSGIIPVQVISPLSEHADPGRRNCACQCISGHEICTSVRVS